MKIKSNATTISAVLMAAAIMGSAPASAVCSGTATFKVRFFQNQGNFCPTISDPTRDCSSTQYDESMFGVNQVVSGTKAYLFKTGGAAIGSGITDANGDVTMTWIDFSCSSGSISAVMNWRFQHGDDRFAVKDITGATWSSSSSPVTLTNGATQNLGTFTKGSSATPDPLANVYDGASRMWEFALNDSAHMRSYFTGLDILAFEPSVGATCPTSCAIGTSTVRLDAAAEFKPQARIMHEMGHIASQWAHPSQNFQFGGNYNFPSGTPGGGGWSMTTSEWSHASFEEGYATFLGDRSIYWQGNDEPTTCNSTSFCSNSASTNTETTVGSGLCASTGGTGSTEERNALNVIRFLRDIYDTNSDFTDDVLASSYASIIDTAEEFGTGTIDSGKNEPWNSGLTALDDNDGHCTTDFGTAYFALTGNSAADTRVENCDQPGD